MNKLLRSYLVLEFMDRCFDALGTSKDFINASGARSSPNTAPKPQGLAELVMLWSWVVVVVDVFFLGRLGWSTGPFKGSIDPPR